MHFSDQKDKQNQSLDRQQGIIQRIRVVCAMYRWDHSSTRTI